MTVPDPVDSDFLADHRRASRRLGRSLALAIALAMALMVSVLACIATQPMMAPSIKPGPERIDAARLEAHVRFLSLDCFPRPWNNPGGLAKAGAHITEAFQQAGGRSWTQTFMAGGRRFANHGATFGPETGPRIIVGAHYDAYGDLPGADDNASGVAGLLELARRLGSNPPARRVDLIAYTLEEPPHFRTQDMGSARHAASVLKEGAEVRAMIALEMIGRFEDAPDSQRIPFPLGWLYPSEGNFIAVVGRFGDIGLTRTVKSAMRAATPLPVHSLNGPRWIPGVDFSDHHPYWDRGFPAVMVTDTAFNRNRDYHTCRDTPDRLDYRRMAMVVEGVEGAIRALAR